MGLRGGITQFALLSGYITVSLVLILTKKRKTAHVGFRYEYTFLLRANANNTKVFFP